MQNEKIEKTIAQNRERVRLFDIVIPILESEKNKSVSKRLATKMEKAINDEKIHVTYYPDRYGSKEIHVYGGVLGYDDGISFRWSDWGDMWKCKTEADSITQVIEGAHAQRQNAIDYIPVLERELELLPEMITAYAKIHKDYIAACKAFSETYGNDKAYFSRNVSYTTRAELERITGCKIDL